MTIEEVKQLLELGRTYGLKAMTVGELSVDFYPAEQGTPNSVPPFSPDFVKQPLTAPTDDDLLFWSSPHTPDFQSKPPSEND